MRWTAKGENETRGERGKRGYRDASRRPAPGVASETRRGGEMRVTGETREEKGKPSWEVTAYSW